MQQEEQARTHAKSVRHEVDKLIVYCLPPFERQVGCDAARHEEMSSQHTSTATYH
jgi:hypothetical protein